jgi:hypothetical protein
MSLRNSFFLIVALTVFAVSAGASVVPATAGPNWQYAPVVQNADMGSCIPLYNDRLDSAVDQEQADGSSYIAAFSQGDLAQSFQQTNANINGAGIYLQPSIGSPAPVTIQLWTNLPNAGGTMLAEATQTGTPGAWVDVYWSYVDITPATTYYLVFTGNSVLGISGSTANPYPNGQCYANTGFGSWPNFDYAFRTFYQLDVALSRDTWAGVKSSF